jgi:hypothetical protein
MSDTIKILDIPHALLDAVSSKNSISSLVRISLIF